MSIYKHHSEELYSDTCIKVYDPEKQELIAVYKSFSKAANRLGVRNSTVQHKCESKNRLFSPILEKEVAVRIGVIKDGDLELMTKTDKNLPLNLKK